MTRPVLLDTGPLVAFLNRRDRYHPWTTAHMARLRPPLLTCEAVLSEACFVLRTWHNGSATVLELLERGLVQVPFCLREEVGRIKRLLTRYANVPMSLADACLVRMTEQYTDSMVLTCDSDFRLYRKHGRQVIPTLMPD